MVEISLSGSGEGPGKATTRGYSTAKLAGASFQGFSETAPQLLSTASLLFRTIPVPSQHRVLCEPAAAVGVLGEIGREAGLAGFDGHCGASDTEAILSTVPHSTKTSREA